MQPEKIDALWNCTAFPSAATKADVHSIFVLDHAFRNAQPRFDWFLSRWKETHDINTTHSTVELDEEGNGISNDGSWGDIEDEFLSLVHRVGVTTVAMMENDSNPNHVEETQSTNTLEAEVECPVQRLQNILVEVLEEARDDRRSLRFFVAASIDNIRSSVGQQQADFLDSESAQFHEKLALLRSEINTLKVQLNKLIALINKMSLALARNCT
ncbi:hypothetical protein L7F22_064879 [Adiantum nelumboides]|nr:hypothetical protein [Adiantum nelumboides]